jgi:2-polyprenyl-6-methoxyphenol hydroxylase-like FAD-dependent oxidoreductase
MRFLFVFRDEYMTGKSPAGGQDAKTVLSNVFADVGWECPQILAAMQEVDEVYFDRVSQIRMNRWSKGRTALIGDAAACVSLLAGEGTGLLRIPLLADFFIGRDLRDDIGLPDYKFD